MKSIRKRAVSSLLLLLAAAFLLESFLALVWLIAFVASRGVKGEYWL